MAEQARPDCKHWVTPLTHSVVINGHEQLVRRRSTIKTRLLILPTRAKVRAVTSYQSFNTYEGTLKGY